MARRRVAGRLLLVLLAAACGDGARNAQRSGPAESAQISSVDQATAARVVRDYFLALGEGRTADARNLFAPGPRSDLSEAELATAADAVESIEVAALEPLELTEERILFAAALDVVSRPGEVVDLQPGRNTRWVEVVYTRRGWRIGRIADQPIAAAAAWSPVSSWAEVHLIEAGLTFEVPNAWQRAPDAWAWSPDGAATPRIAVAWEDAGAGWEPARGLPANARVLRSGELELPWGSGQLYVLEVPGPEPPDISVEEHAVVQTSGNRVYHFVARAADAQEMRLLQWVHRRMYMSAQLMPRGTLAARAGASECRGVTQVDPESPDGRAIGRSLLQLLRETNGRPEGGSLEFERLGPITRSGDWLLVDASFRAHLEPAIFALRAAGGGYRFEGVAWSGAAPGGEREIRGAMTARLPQAPSALLRCADLSRWPA